MAQDHDPNRSRKDHVECPTGPGMATRVHHIFGARATMARMDEIAAKAGLKSTTQTFMAVLLPASATPPGTQAPAA